MNKDKIAREICLEMLKAREYTVIEAIEEKIICKDKLGSTIYVIFPDKKKVDSNTVEIYLSQLKEMNVQHAIFIAKEKLTPKANEILKKGEIYTELFLVDELQFNITEHRLVPKHIKVEDKTELQSLRKYIAFLPVLLQTDPVSRFYNYSKKDLIKIIRHDGLIAYRIVR